MDLLKRISASVILAAPFFFAVDGFAAAKTAKAKAESSSSINFAGKLGLAYLNVAGASAFDATDTFRPELTIYGSPSNQFGFEQVWFAGIKVNGHTNEASPYAFETLGASSLAGAAVKLNTLGVKTKFKFGQADVGMFPSKSMLVLGNNFSMVSAIPTNISQDFKMFVPGSVNTGSSRNVMPVGLMLGDWSGQGKSFHIAYTTPSFMSSDLTLSYVPMNSKNANDRLIAKNDSFAYTLNHHGEVMGIKYDARAGYTNKTRTPGAVSSVALTIDGEVKPAESPAVRSFHTDQTAFSLAFEKSGVSLSAGFADHKWKNVPIEYYRAMSGAAIDTYTNSNYAGSTKISTYTRLKNPKLIDFSLGYQKPMLGGHGAVKLGHTVSSNYGTGLQSEYALLDTQFSGGTRAGGAKKLIQRNRTHVTSVGFAHHVKNLSTGLFLNHYRNHHLYQDSSKVADDIFNAVELGTNYAF